MNTLYLLLFALSSLAPAAQSLSVYAREEPAVVRFDIQRRKIDRESSHLRRRDNGMTVGERIYNEDSFYFSNITIGTPGQELGVVLDTGSSDLWCNVANSAFCEQFPSDCSITGTFNPNTSSTFSFISNDFNISYADGTGASGWYVSDKIRFGNAVVTNFQFALGLQSDSPVGVLGIGYPSNEASATRFGEKPYANLPVAMANAGLINSVAYSLWLNDLSASTGSILFGGIDTEKFHGELQTLPVIQGNGGYMQLVIALTDVSLNSSTGHHSYGSKSLPVAALLDSGSTLTYLPDPIANDIYNDLNATYDPSSASAFVPCSIADHDINITYTFSSPSITVGIRELVLSAGDSFFQDGTRACLFGVVPAGQNNVVLGDTFLRSAYVVYDLSNNEISLANTRFNSTGSNILEIGSGPNSVPSSTAAQNPVTSVLVGGSGARIGGPTGSATGLPGPSTTTKSAAASAMTPNLTGCGVAGLFFWYLLGI